jgi:hypothetical protein
MYCLTTSVLLLRSRPHSTHNGHNTVTDSAERMRNRVYGLTFLLSIIMLGVASHATAQDDLKTLERRFSDLPPESRRLTGPLFWLHGDESDDRLRQYVNIVAQGGNGCFTAESRPHSDWLGPGWFRDLAICLDQAKRNNLRLWIFDEKWYPSQDVAGKVPPRHAAKRLGATAVDVSGPRLFEAEGYAGDRFVAVVAGRLTSDDRIDSDSLVNLATQQPAGKLVWQVPAGRWRIMKFTHVQAPPLSSGNLGVDGASRDSVEWFLRTVYQSHYDHFVDEFGRTIAGFFYDEPETVGDWGTELNAVLAERNVDWKKAYVAYKFELAGEDQIAARYQYLDALAEAWGRTMYGGMTKWCHEHRVQSIGHFWEHDGLYHNRGLCAGDLMRLQGYSDMGAIDVVSRQIKKGQRETSVRCPQSVIDFFGPNDLEKQGRQGRTDTVTWQIPKLGSSVSHVYGKTDDVAMVEAFGASGQDLEYSEMKWCTDHLQVSGINFIIPHSFNPRSPYDTDCPPYFYNGGYEPRWPLYRVYADYTSRLSLMLTGGRHICPVAILLPGQSLQVGHAVGPEMMTSALQDVQFDCDWVPCDVFTNNCRIVESQIILHKERYRVLVVPPMEVVPYSVITKVRDFFNAGGVVIGYGFPPTKSATIGHGARDITRLTAAVWGDSPAPGRGRCHRSSAGGRSYFLPEQPTPQDVNAVLADADIRPTLEVVSGDTGGWLHALHRQKSGQDVFFVCNQNHEGGARRFKFLATASGEPELWDAMRNEITSFHFKRAGERQVEFWLELAPSESALIVFRPSRSTRPIRIDSTVTAVGEPIMITRGSNAHKQELPPLDPGRAITLGGVVAAKPFFGTFVLPRDLTLSRHRICLEMKGLPDDSAAITVNGVYAGGMIGQPLRLDISRHVRPAENNLETEPFSPESARIVVYRSEGRESE